MPPNVTNSAGAQSYRPVRPLKSGYQKVETTSRRRLKSCVVGQRLPDGRTFRHSNGAGQRNASEALALRWADVHMQSAPTAKFDYPQVQKGKSVRARRTVSLTARVQTMLAARPEKSSSEFVFPSRTGKPMLVTSLDHLHAKVRESLKMPADFVVHSLRHTMLTRLGMLGVEAFTIMKIAGHSSITISQRYVHPSPESVERAFEKLEVSNQLPPRIGVGIHLGIGSKMQFGKITVKLSN
jgi:integrase